MIAVAIVIAWLIFVGFVVCLCAAAKTTPEQREAIRQAHKEWMS